MLLVLLVVVPQQFPLTKWLCNGGRRGGWDEGGVYKIKTTMRRNKIRHRHNEPSVGSDPRIWRMETTRTVTFSLLRLRRTGSSDSY